MATTTWYVNKDARIADNGSNLGAGASDYLPVGKYGGYQYRSLLGFAYSWTGMVSITSAILHIKTSSQYYVAFGSGPSVRIQRLTAAWSEGSSVGLSGSNAVVYPGPASTTTNAVTLSPGTAENTWKTADITAMIQDVFGGTFHGIRLIGWNGSSESTSSTDVSEFYAREYGANDAYITVTYTTNNPASAPTLTAPANNLYSTTATPTFQFTHVDADGDGIMMYDLQVSTDISFASVTHWNVAASGTGIVGNNVSRVYAGSALTTGTWYYWRARTYSITGDASAGAWSTTRAFKVAATPTCTLTEPSATGRLGKLSYTAGSGWSSPRLNAQWTFSCADGDTQASYELDVANDSAGSPGSSLYSSGVVSTTGTLLVIPATLTEGNYYHVRVRVTCSHGKTSSYSGYFRIRTRWGVVAHRKDLGSAPTSWTITAVNTTALSNNAVTVEYGSDSAANASPTGGYKASLGSVTLNRYFYYRAWLLSWGTSPATSPSLDKLVLSYTSNALVPDKWLRSQPSTQTVDESTYVYGTQSIKMVADGTTQTVSQLVQVTPDTDYVLSGRIKAEGNPQAILSIAASQVGGNILGSVAIGATQDWARSSTTVWNSGSNTQIWISCRLINNGTVGAIAWFDAIKFEASKVVTPWSPSFLADAVVLDAGGLQIDASNGGIFRLRGSSGGSRDRVDLGAKGLVFGGDATLYSDAADILRSDDTIRSDAHAAKTVDFGGSGTSTTITTAGTYYPLTSAATATFTPAFVGQRFLCILTGYVSLNTTTAQYAFVRLEIQDNGGSQIAVMGYGRAENRGVNSRGDHVAVAHIWTADAVATRKLVAMGTVELTNGLNLALNYAQMLVVPLL